MGRRNRKGRSIHGILLLDKPAGISSNQALQRAKRLFDARKAGHTGSLDPLATGMLPVCFGEATKLSSYLLDADKAYRTTLRLGVTTDSGDADGTVLTETPPPAELDREGFERIVERFRGTVDQIPPMVSALKIDGQRLYKLAREGVTVEREPRRVTFHSIDIDAFDGQSATLSVRCSKGTYIRSLVTDIGDAIGCGAHVVMLRRTAVAPFNDMPCHSMDTLAANDDARRLQYLLPPDAGLGHLPSVAVDSADEPAFLQGRTLNGRVMDAAADDPDATMTPPLLFRVYADARRFLGLAETRDATAGAIITGSVDAGQSVIVEPRRVLQWNN